jgi:hypothetical protein
MIHAHYQLNASESGMLIINIRDFLIDQYYLFQGIGSHSRGCPQSAPLDLATTKARIQRIRSRGDCEGLSFLALTRNAANPSIDLQFRYVLRLRFV